MAAYMWAKHGMVRQAALLASIACVGAAAAAQPPAQLIELSLTNAPFVLRDGRTALASVIEVGFAPGDVQPDPVGAEQITSLVKRVGPACIRSMQVIGHADEAVGADSTHNAIQARARADGIATIIETDGLEPEKVARLWSDHRSSETSGATVWVFVDGMRTECALASTTAMASAATMPNMQTSTAVGSGTGAVELIEGQFALHPGGGEVVEAPIPPPQVSVPEMSRRLDLSLPGSGVAPVPARKPSPPARVALMGVDEGKGQPGKDRTLGSPRPAATLAFADNSSYLSEKAAKALDRLSREILAGPSCHLELQGTVAATGTDPEYARWLATRRMARVEEGLRSRLSNRSLVFQHKLRERDDSRSVTVTPRTSTDCQATSQTLRQVTAQAAGPIPAK